MEFKVLLQGISTGIMSDQHKKSPQRLQITVHRMAGVTSEQHVILLQYPTSLISDMIKMVKIWNFSLTFTLAEALE